jgi:hypothetical protein
VRGDPGEFFSVAFRAAARVVTLFQHWWTGLGRGTNHGPFGLNKDGTSYGAAAGLVLRLAAS